MFKLFNSSRRDLNAKQKINIVYSAFGSIEDFSRQIARANQVARELNLVRQTVYYNLSRFQRLNYNMVDYLKTKKRPGRTRKVIGSHELEQTLLSDRCLKQWAHLSVYKRCVKIKQLYDVHVPKESLRQFYIRHGLGYKAAKGDLYPHGKDLNELNQEQQAFAMKLSDFILDGNTEVIYFDKTSFHS